MPLQTNDANEEMSERKIAKLKFPIHEIQWRVGVHHLRVTAERTNENEFQRKIEFR